MVVTPLTTAIGMAPAMLALSKAAWKLGSSLSELDQDTKPVDTAVQSLVGEVKSLGNECNLVYAELEEGVSKNKKTGSPPPYDHDGRIRNCLALQVEDTGRTMRELELFVQSARGDESSFISQAQHQRKLDTSKDQIASIRTQIGQHTDNLHTTLLIINM